MLRPVEKIQIQFFRAYDLGCSGYMLSLPLQHPSAIAPNDTMKQLGTFL